MLPRLPHSKSRALAIWACGDSFTFGSGASWSWRLPLVGLVEDHRPSPLHEPIAVWLGTQVDSYAHDGHPGYSIPNLDLTAWSASLGATPTDIILQGGANDWALGATAATILTRFATAVALAHSLFPLARIYACKPMQATAAYEAGHVGYNAAMATVAAGFPIAGANTIDWSGVSTAGLQGDGLHPGNSTHEAMAVLAHAAMSAAGAFA